MDMGFGTRNMRSLYKAGSLMTITKAYQNMKFSGITGSPMGQVTSNQPVNMQFPMERRMRILNKVQGRVC
jgi:hypothetical protein